MTHTACCLMGFYFEDVPEGHATLEIAVDGKMTHHFGDPMPRYERDISNLDDAR